MSKYQELLLGKIKFKEGKKWKERFCVINKLNDAADHLRLHLTKDRSEYNRLRQSAGSIEDLPFYGLVYGFEHGRHVDGVRNVIVFVCSESVLLLAFENFEEMNKWRQQLHIHLIDVWYRVRLDRALDGSKLITGEDCYLHVQSSRIVLVSESASKLIWAWNYRNIKNYGIVEDSFIVVGSSSSGKGRGTHYFSVDGKDKLEALYNDVHAYTCGSIPPSVIIQRNSEESNVLRPYLTKQVASLGTKSVSHSIEESSTHHAFSGQSDHNQSSGSMLANSSTEFDLRTGNSVGSIDHRQQVGDSQPLQRNDDSTVLLRSPEIRIPPSRKASDGNQSSLFKSKNANNVDEFRGVSSNAEEVFDNEEHLFFPQDIVQEDNVVGEHLGITKQLNDVSDQVEYAVPNALPGHIYANISSSIHVHQGKTATPQRERELIKQGLRVDVLPSRHNLPVIRSAIKLPSSYTSPSGYLDMKEVAAVFESSSPVYMVMDGDNSEYQSSTPENYLFLKDSNLQASGSWETLPLPKKPTSNVGLQQTSGCQKSDGGICEESGIATISVNENSALCNCESSTSSVMDNGGVLNKLLDLNSHQCERNLATSGKTLRHRSISENSAVDSFDNPSSPNPNEELTNAATWTTLIKNRSHDFKRSVSQEGHKVASPRTGQEYVPRQRLASSSSSCGTANGTVAIDGSDSLADSFVDIGVAGPNSSTALHDQTYSIRTYVNVGPNLCNDPFMPSDTLQSMTSSWHSYYHHYYHTPSTSFEHPYANLDMRQMPSSSRLTASTTLPFLEQNPSSSAEHSSHAGAPESAIGAKRIEYALLDHSPGHSTHSAGSTPLSQLTFSLPLNEPNFSSEVMNNNTPPAANNTAAFHNHAELAQLSLTSPSTARPASTGGATNSASNYFQVDFERMECLKHTTDEWRRQKAAEEKAFVVNGNSNSTGQSSGGGGGLRRISMRSFRTSAQGRKTTDASSTAS